MGTLSFRLDFNNLAVIFFSSIVVNRADDVLTFVFRNPYYLNNHKMRRMFVKYRKRIHQS